MSYRFTPWTAVYVGYTQNRAILDKDLRDRRDPRTVDGLVKDGGQFFVKGTIRNKWRRRDLRDPDSAHSIVPVIDASNEGIIALLNLAAITSFHNLSSSPALRSQ